MVKLKRLKIRRYRDVEPCELVFSDRFNVLLGANGAGKTTLLDLVSKVLRTNLDDGSDPLSIVVELAFPGGTLTGTIESVDDTRTTPPELRVARAARPASPQVAQLPMFSFRIERFEPASIVEIRRTDDKVEVVRDGMPPEEQSLRWWEIYPHLLAQAAALVRAPDDLGRGIYDDLHNAWRFDESLDMFRSVAARQDDHVVVSADLRPYVMCTRPIANGSVEAAWPAVPLQGMVSPAILGSINSRLTEGAAGVSFEQGDLGFLDDTVRLLGLRAATAKLELTGKRVQKGPGLDLFDFGNLNFWFTRKDGAVFQAQHLSYGQKRLLTFLYYLDCNPSFVIADELVNGLHHAWLQECMKAIGDRQAFLTSQNPLLLDYLSFDSVEQVKESFILCRNETVGDRDRMIWRNLTDDEADMFYSAYKVGIEHVGEILRTRGLW